METDRRVRSGQGLQTDRSRGLTDRGSLTAACDAQRTGRERDAASSGAGSAGGCTLQGPQLVPRCVSRVLRRRPSARRECVVDRADRKQRKKTRAARCLLAAAEACTRRRGQYGGFFAADTACAGAACLAASTTSEKLAAGGCDFRCVAACILKAPTTRRERVGVGDRTPRRRAQRGCTLLH